MQMFFLLGICCYQTVLICCVEFTRAGPNRRSLLFGQIRIIKTIIWLNVNRIRIVALNFRSNVIVIHHR